MPSIETILELANQTDVAQSHCMQHSSTPDDVPAAHEDQRKCMEVWGGNASTNTHFRRPGLDIWVWSRSQGSSQAGGGDLHLLSSCASGRITRMLLADVCGFDKLFADVAGQFRDLMVRNVNTIKQTRLVEQMGRGLENCAHQGAYASALVTTYFAPTRSFSLCNAGYTPPLLYRAESDEWLVLKHAPSSVGPATAPLGVIDRHEYQNFTTKLHVGDLVLGYSNVLSECAGPNQGTLGIQGLLELVRETDPRRPEVLVPELVARIQNCHADNLASTDATLLLCQVTEKSVGFRDNVLAPFRLLRAVSDKTEFQHDDALRDEEGRHPAQREG